MRTRKTGIRNVIEKKFIFRNGLTGSLRNDNVKSNAKPPEKND